MSLGRLWKNKLLCNNMRRFWTRLLRNEVELTFERRTVKYSSSQSYICIRPLRNKNGTGAEMPPAVVCGIVSEDSPVSYWPFFAVPSNISSRLCESSFDPSPSSFISDKFRRYALYPIGLNPLRHLMKFAQPSIPYRFGIVIKVKQQYWLGWSTENSNYG